MAFLARTGHLPPPVLRISHRSLPTFFVWQEADVDVPLCYPCRAPPLVKAMFGIKHDDLSKLKTEKARRKRLTELEQKLEGTLRAAAARTIGARGAPSSCRVQSAHARGRAGKNALYADGKLAWQAGAVGPDPDSLTPLEVRYISCVSRSCCTYPDLQAAGLKA
jgi:hypothetical protein